MLSDFLLILLRDAILAADCGIDGPDPRPNEARDGGVACGMPKVVCMSATLDAELFASYLGADTPIVRVPGRTFPVRR